MGANCRSFFRVFLLLVFSLLLTCSAIALAETDLTGKVQLMTSEMRYDHRTLTNSQNVSLKNISQDVLLTPVKVVIENISQATVTVMNPDGTTADRKPYFRYEPHSGQVYPHQDTGSRKWVFSNPQRDEFTYTCSVWGGIHHLVSLDYNGSFYSVVIDLTHGGSHRQVGEQYGELVSKIPELESRLDAFLQSQATPYNEMIGRAREIKKSLQPEYLDEIEGFASKFSGGQDNTPGDGKLSLDEIYALNFFADVLRPFACSVFAVYGNRSATGSTIIGRNHDWHGATSIVTVFTIKNGRKSVCLIGLLFSISGSITINEKGIFAGVTDSPTGAPYEYLNKRSYHFDIRYALENFKTIDDIFVYMSDPDKRYTFNHNYVLADAHTAKVLENNFSGSGTNMRRALRSDDSELNGGVQWGFDDAIGCVNSFVLKGNHDNHTFNSFNYLRWDSFRSFLAGSGPTIDREGVKAIMSDQNGSVYNNLNVHSVIFEPRTMQLEIAVRPPGDDLPAQLQFEKIDLDFKPHH